VASASCRWNHGLEGYATNYATLIERRYSDTQAAKAASLHAMASLWNVRARRSYAVFERAIAEEKAGAISRESRARLALASLAPIAA